MGATLRHSEEGRKLAHIAAGSLALLLRYLSWWEAAVVVSLALAFNIYGLPRIAQGQLMRDAESRRILGSGVVLYPLSILLMVLVLPERLDIVAAAWGILAVGDGVATIAGRRIRSPRIPWNPAKSVAGTAAFAISGAAAGAFLCWWCRPAVVPPPFLWFSLGAPVFAALVAALVETIPIELDDNLTVASSAAATMWWASLVSEDMVTAALPVLLAATPAALLANVAAAGAGYAAGIISRSGAVAGACIGIVVMLSTGRPGWGLLLATLALAAVSSRIGLERKTRLGIAEPNAGRRGAPSAAANTIVAAAAGVLAVVSYAKEPALIAFAAALAAAGSDTVASEVGKAWGNRAYLLPRFRRVPAGTPGALSVEGTAAGIAGAFALAGLAVLVGLLDPDNIAIVVLAATAGSLVESLLGAALEPRGFVNSHVLNVITTAVAALVAVGLA